MTTHDQSTHLPVFDLPEHLAAKADPALLSADQRHLLAINFAIEYQTSDLTQQLATLKKQPRGTGEYALERDANIYRIISRLRLLKRFNMDLTLGRIVTGAEPDTSVYIGRMGLTDAQW